MVQLLLAATSSCHVARYPGRLTEGYLPRRVQAPRRSYLHVVSVAEVCLLSCEVEGLSLRLIFVGDKIS
jgi:hypothetical protein